MREEEREQVASKVLAWTAGGRQQNWLRWEVRRARLVGEDGGFQSGRVEMTVGLPRRVSKND